SLDATLLLIAAWLAIGLAGMLAPRSLRLASRVLFPGGAVAGLALAAVALQAIFGLPASRVLPLGLPDLPFHARIDALSAFFLLLLGAVAAGISTFACGYLLAGVGAKAGVVPLHVWLPEAHPAAPSPVSALMSAVMLKTAVYGMLRVTLDLIGLPLWWWGVIALAAGLVSALFGIVFAAVQTD